MILLLSLAVIIFASFDGSGGDFHEEFKRFDDSFWTKNHNKFSCVDTDCVLTREEKVHVLTKWGVGTPGLSTMLEISMEKDCNFEECCTLDKCTKFSSGQVTSKQTFRYGRFMYSMIAPRPRRRNSEISIDGWGCVSLFRDESEKKHSMEISLCVSSMRTHHAILSVSYGADKIILESPDLEYDSTKFLISYEIFWLRDSIRFYGASKLLHTIQTHTPGNFLSKIPDEPLRLRIMLQNHNLPSDSPKIYQSEETRLAMLVSSIMYTHKHFGHQGRIELFIIGHKSASNYYMLGCFSLFIFLKLFYSHFPSFRAYGKLKKFEKGLLQNYE